jgi:antitoxin (DNA-binding transcriptional repressor) of toxin-antitoxin stability system
MTTMTVTNFSRRLRAALDRIEHGGEEIVLVRNKNKIARILPGTPHMTAREAMGDLYHTLDEDAARTWVSDGRLKQTLGHGTRNPWVS